MTEGGRSEPHAPSAGPPIAVTFDTLSQLPASAGVTVSTAPSVTRLAFY